MFCETIEFLLSVVVDSRTMLPIKFEENKIKQEIVNPKLIIKKDIKNIENQETKKIDINPNNQITQKNIDNDDSEYIDYKIVLKEQCWDNVEDINNFNIIYEMSESFEKMEVIGYDSEEKIYYVTYKK